MPINNPTKGLRLLTSMRGLRTLHAIITLDYVNDEITYAGFCADKSVLPDGAQWEDVYQGATLVNLYENGPLTTQYMTEFTTKPEFDWRSIGLHDRLSEQLVGDNATFFRFAPGGMPYTYKGKFTFSMKASEIGADEIDVFSFIEFPVGLDGSLTSWRSRHVETEGAKMRNSIRLRAVAKETNLLTVFVPSKGSRLEDCTITLEANETAPVPLVNRAFDVQRPYVPSEDKPYAVEEYVRIDVPAGLTVEPDAILSIPVQVRWKNGTPYAGDPLSLVVEATSGYLPIRRLDIGAAGVGTFRVAALAMESGDVIKVKIGTRHFTSLASVTIPVI